MSYVPSSPDDARVLSLAFHTVANDNQQKPKTLLEMREEAERYDFWAQTYDPTFPCPFDFWGP